MNHFEIVSIYFFPSLLHFFTVIWMIFRKKIMNVPLSTLKNIDG